MTSSVAAQNHGSRNAHQNPVKSHKGGYLRCPFDISASYAELAEKRVRDDLARGTSARAGAAVADKDGGLPSSSSRDGDGLEGNEGRPWSRAGVGASKLSGKEKRTQQEQAELIYGRGSLASAEDATSGAAALGHGPSQENMFAVDTREKAALQQVVPRAVREKVKKRKLEELRQGRVQLGQHHIRHKKNEDDDVPEKGHEQQQQQQDGDEDDESKATQVSKASMEARMSASSSPHNDRPTFKTSSAPRKIESASHEGLPQHRSPRQVAAPPPSSAQVAVNKPKNRMQVLDDLRASALMGKKRRR